MKNILPSAIALFWLCALTAKADPTIDIKKLAEKHKDHLLSPEDVASGIPTLDEGQFPLRWTQTSYGQVKNKTDYKYLFLKKEDTKIYYQLEADGNLIDHTKYYIEAGREYTYNDKGSELDVGMKNGCIFVVGDCIYPYIRSTKTLTTTFKNGIWTSEYSNGSGKGVLTTLYNKFGIIIYRHSLVKNSIQHFESETFLQE